MIIKKLELINFRSYQHQVIEFSDGVNLIVGDNGAGKTSIVYAIAILLFNYKFVSLGNLITDGWDTSSIKLTAEHDGDEYIISKTFGRSSSTLLIKNNSIIATGASDVGDVLSSLFGYSQSTMGEVTIVKNPTLLFDLTPSIRQKMVNTLLGLEKWREYYEKFGTAIHTIDKMVEKKISDVDSAKQLALYIFSTLKDRKEISAIIEQGKPQVHAPNTYKVAEGLRYNIRSIEEELEGFENPEYLDSEILRLKKQLDGYNRAKQQIDELRASIEYVNMSMKTIKEESICPACRQEISSGSETAFDYFTKLSDSIKADIKRRETRLFDDPTPTLYRAQERQRKLVYLLGKLERDQKRLDSLPIVTEDEYLQNFKYQQALKRQAEIDESIKRICKERKTMLELREEIANLKELKEKLKLYREYIKEISELLSTSYRETLATYLRDNLEYIFRRSIGIDIDEFYTVTLDFDGIKVPYVSLSDGQQTGAALCFRLALSRLVTPLGLIVLDEPTNSLDDKTRAELINLLNRQDFGQIIIVTHNQEFNANNVISLKLENGRTVVNG